MEEERRLCYVGITRAMKTLTLTSASRRMRNGNVVYNPPSRFLREIPRYLMAEKNGPSIKRETTSSPAISPAAPAKKAKPKTGGNLFFDNPYIQKGIKLSSQADSGTNGKPDYDAGDKVSHTKFGIGTVISVEKIKDDYEVVIEFEDFGNRKLRSSFARLKKLD